MIKVDVDSPGNTMYNLLHVSVQSTFLSNLKTEYNRTSAIWTPKGKGRRAPKSSPGLYEFLSFSVQAKYPVIGKYSYRKRLSCVLSD